MLKEITMTTWNPKNSFLSPLPLFLCLSLSLTLYPVPWWRSVHPFTTRDRKEYYHKLKGSCSVVSSTERGGGVDQAERNEEMEMIPTGKVVHIINIMRIIGTAIRSRREASRAEEVSWWPFAAGQLIGWLGCCVSFLFFHYSTNTKTYRTCDTKKGPTLLLA